MVSTGLGNELQTERQGLLMTMTVREKIARADMMAALGDMVPLLIAYDKLLEAEHAAMAVLGVDSAGVRFQRGLIQHAFDKIDKGTGMKTNRTGRGPEPSPFEPPISLRGKRVPR